MGLRRRLILNFILVFLIAFIIVRDRLPSDYFELSISTSDGQSIKVSPHLINCQISSNLNCKIPILHQTLVIEEVEPPSLQCRAKLGKQIPTCHWLQASALELISVEDLKLTPIELFLTKHSIKPFPTARIFDDPGTNASFLVLVLGVLSVLSGFNVAESVFLYTCRCSPHRNHQIKTKMSSIYAAIAGFGVFCFLGLGFMVMLWFFRYLGD